MHSENNKRYEDYFTHINNTKKFCDQCTTNLHGDTIVKINEMLAMNYLKLIGILELYIVQSI